MMTEIDKKPLALNRNRRRPDLDSGLVLKSVRPFDVGMTMDLDEFGMSRTPKMPPSSFWRDYDILPGGK